MIYKKVEHFKNLLVSIETLKRVDNLFKKIFLDKMEKICENKSSYTPKPSLIRNLEFVEGDSISVESDKRLNEVPDIDMLREIGLKKTEVIEFRYYYNNIDSVYLKLSEGSRSSSGAVFRIETNSEEFLHKTVNDIHLILRGCDPIGHYPYKYENFIYFCLWIIITSLFANVHFAVTPVLIKFGMVPQNSVYVIHENLMTYLIFYAFFGFLSSFIMPGIAMYYKKIFPVLEFDFGPLHLRPRLAARKRLSFIIIIILIPYIIAIMANYA